MKAITQVDITVSGERTKLKPFIKALTTVEIVNKDHHPVMIAKYVNILFPVHIDNLKIISHD